jgi:hypothetical protein
MTGPAVLLTAAANLDVVPPFDAPWMVGPQGRVAAGKRRAPLSAGTAQPRLWVGSLHLPRAHRRPRLPPCPAPLPPPVDVAHRILGKKME